MSSGIVYTCTCKHTPNSVLHFTNKSIKKKIGWNMEFSIKESRKKIQYMGNSSYAGMMLEHVNFIVIEKKLIVEIKNGETYTHMQGN